jgi:hypothetical protein
MSFHRTGEAGFDTFPETFAASRRLQLGKDSGLPMR